MVSCPSFGDNSLTAQTEPYNERYVLIVDVLKSTEQRLLPKPALGHGAFAEIKDKQGNLIAVLDFKNLHFSVNKNNRWYVQALVNETTQKYPVIDLQFPSNNFFSVALTSTPLEQLLASVPKRNEPSQINALELVTCGPSHITIYEVDSNNLDKPAEIKWSWFAKNNTSLPKSIVNTFLHIDECKPLANGELILITSSTGGNALIERSSGKLLYYAYAIQAHSIELLPENKLVIAVSSYDNYGDELLLLDFQATSLTPLQRLSLQSAHGVYLDKSNQHLWAIGKSRLSKYLLNDMANSTAQLVKVFETNLPSLGGHDLSPVSGKRQHLFVTSNSQVLIYDPITNTFHEHTELIAKQFVKSISQMGSKTAYVQADFKTAVWWSRCVNILNNTQICADDRRFYKARWVIK